MHPDDEPQPPSNPTMNVTQGLLVAGAAMGATAALVVVNWFLTELFGGAAVVLVVLLVTVAGAYLWFRQQNAAQARAMESRVKQFTGNAMTQMSARYAARGTAGGTGYPSPPAAGPLHPGVPYVAPTGAASDSSAGLVSALLLLPSLLAYGLVYGSASFSSVWQPWWIINGLNLFFVLCVLSRARSAGQRTAAMLPAIAGLVIIGLATSPSRDVSLTSIFSTRHSVGGYTYTAPSPDLMPWLMRAPMLTILLFVLAWGLARRQGSWALGLIPAGLVLWWAIWYRENAFTGEAGWIGVWGLNVGVFVVGCLACWAADALTRPQPAPQQQHWPR